MESRKKVISDIHVYRWVTFPPDALKFYLAALRFYQNLLQNDLEAIERDPSLSAVLDKELLKSFQLTRELNQIRLIGDDFEKHVKSKPTAFDYEINIAHGSVRLIKSVCKVYLKHLDSRRNELGSRDSISRAALEMIDTRLAKLSEWTNIGIFKDVESWPLLIEDIAEARAEYKLEEHRKISAPPPKIASTIELLDREIRERCLDLFNTFSEEDQSQRFDTVVAEATRILEDRIRRLSGAEPTRSGLDLVSFAFGGQQPKLRLGESNNEHEAAHLLFRGVFGFIRNPFHHRLMGSVEKERVIQILGLVDYLLYLAESAERQP